MAKGGKQDELQPIIVKKVIKKGGGHHGGAWKVAYADFVTAMMAFFLLLWLLNVSTDDALEVISSYFDPSHPKVSTSTSGAGGVMGGLTMTPDGSMAENRQRPVPQQNSGTNQMGKDSKDNTIKKLEEELRAAENKRFEEAKQELEEQLRTNPELAELAKHLMVDITPEGLRIQIIDQEGKPMFASGSAEMLPNMEKLMSQVAGVIIPMHNDASVRGHTDAVPYPPGATYTNWELSADRANSARRALIGDNVPKERIGNVMGKADTEHLIEDNPRDPQNRRISIIMLRESLAEAYERGAFDENEIDQETEDAIESGDYRNYLPQINDSPTGSFQKTPGSVYFP